MTIEWDTRQPKRRGRFHPSDRRLNRQQLRNAFPDDQAPRYLVHDRDSAFAEVATTVAGMHIKAVRTGLAVANAYDERLIGSIRRKCLDHVIVVNERIAPCAHVICRVLRTVAHASGLGERQPGASASASGLDRPHRGDARSGRPASPLRSRRGVALPVRDVLSL